MTTELRTGDPVTRGTLEAQNAPAPAAPPAAPSIFLDPVRFDTAQRSAKALVHSPLVPEAFRAGSKNSFEQAVANCLIAMNLAERMNEDPLTIMQNLHIIGGKPGWDAEFMIARANSSGVFREDLDYEEEGKGDAYRVRAYALRHNGKPVHGSWVSMGMAKMEGWTRNKKYESMPDHMLKYRAATFFIRQHCPQVMGAVRHTADEMEDMRVVSEAPARPEAEETTKALQAQAAESAEPAPEAGEAEPPGALFPEPEDDFDPGQFTADAMARIRNARDGKALDAWQQANRADLDRLKASAPKSYETVLDAFRRRWEALA